MAQGGGTQFLKSRGIKIHIRQGAEQGLGRKVVHGAVGNALCARTQGDIRQFAQLRHKGVLHFSNVSLLAANAHLFTALASTGLLALIAEHMEILRIKGVRAAIPACATKFLSPEDRPHAVRSPGGWRRLSRGWPRQFPDHLNMLSTYGSRILYSVTQITKYAKKPLQRRRESHTMKLPRLPRLYFFSGCV